MSDGFFFLSVFFFIFVAWIATGGPTKPISFAGPYITPITNVGVTQIGYGPQVGGLSGSGTAVQGTVSSIQRSIDSIRNQISSGNVVANASPYHGQVTIGYGSNVSTTDPDKEYISIRLNSGAKAPVDITGWRVQSTESGYSAVIPEGTQMLRISGNTEAPIMLQPGDTAILTTGVSPIGLSFKENECVGYYASQGDDDFTPSIQQRCPDASDEYDKYYTGNTYRDDACYNMVQDLNRCEIPHESSTDKLSSYCYQFIDARLNYQGCVATHQGDKGFMGTTWRVYLGRTKITNSHSSAKTYGELWRSTRDEIQLLDANGKTVDLYDY